MIETYQVLPLQATVDLGAMAIKEYSTFPKAPALLEPHQGKALALNQSQRLICY